jgi:hypothetical protein
VVKRLERADRLDVTLCAALLFEAMPRVTANSYSIRPFFFFARAFTR